MNTSKTNKNRQQKRNHRSKSSDSSIQNGFFHTLKSSLFGAVIGIACAFVLMMIGAFVCYSSGDPHKLIGAVSLVALYLSSLISGFAAVRRNSSSALLCGGLSGAFLMLFFIVCSIFFDSGSSFDFPVSILLRVGIIAVAALGGFSGLKRNTNKRKTRKANR
jgi:putative membrane protein (TIGR04086 family)